MVEEAMQQHKTAFEEMKMSCIDSSLDAKSALEKSYFNIFPQLQKELEGIYMERLLSMNQPKNDPEHKKIMQTKEAFVENDDFDQKKRLKPLLKRENFLSKGF